MSKDILKKAKAHFNEHVIGEMKQVEVPEWDTTIFFKSGTNFAQEAKVIELQNAGKSAEALVQVLINRALDKDGKKIFTDHQKAELMNSVDPAVILKVVTEINNSKTPSIQEAEGN
jgi:hypothetical protein|tara:strand:+ start:724 stop:1071 length:348 start_codon:yes stop_codon:yes gene_type:complete